MTNWVGCSHKSTRTQHSSDRRFGYDLKFGGIYESKEENVVDGILGFSSIPLIARVFHQVSVEPSNQNCYY